MMFWEILEWHIIICSSVWATYTFISCKSVKRKKSAARFKTSRTGFQRNQHIIWTVQSCILNWQLCLILFFNSVPIFHEVVLLGLTNCWHYNVIDFLCWVYILQYIFKTENKQKGGESLCTFWLWHSEVFNTLVVDITIGRSSTEGYSLTLVYASSHSKGNWLSQFYNKSAEKLRE